MVMKNTSQAQNYGYNGLASGSHRKIIELVGRDKRVLDVGCNRGYLGSRLKENGCYVAGIEEDEESARQAKGIYDEVLSSDVQTVNVLLYSEHYFDCIIFADILEHLRRPEEVLFKLKKYLKPEGRIIVSLPNVARLDIRLKLLLGRFDYEDCGIMDRTHLRFFTLKTAKKLIQECGFRIESIDYTGIASRIRILPSLLAFQFVIVGRKS